MTIEQMISRVRSNTRTLRGSIIQPHEIEQLLFDTMVDFCTETKVACQTQDITIIEEGGAAKQEYNLPGLEGPASSYVATNNVWVDGVKVGFVDLGWIAKPTGTSPVMWGDEWMGETIPDYPWAGSGEDAYDQYAYTRNNRLIGFFPPLAVGVAIRHDYVWCPDTGWMAVFTLARGAAGRRQISEFIPAGWHRYLVAGATAKLYLDYLNDKTKHDIHYANYLAGREQARTQQQEKSGPDSARGLYY